MTNCLSPLALKRQNNYVFEPPWVESFIDCNDLYEDDLSFWDNLQLTTGFYAHDIVAHSANKLSSQAKEQLLRDAYMGMFLNFVISHRN